MKNYDLNKVPQKLKQNEITLKEAINTISSFVCQNYPVFGLHHYDEDFREEVLLSILEKGSVIFEKYDPTQGNFFNYFYCYITSIVRTKIRTLAKKNIAESVAIAEHSKNLEEKEYNYNNINYNYFNCPKVKYSKDEIKLEEIQKGYEHISKDKEMLIIALKSSFYITDIQYNFIINHYKIKRDIFYKSIEYCRSTLVKKSEKKLMFQERRNHAYYNHKKFQHQINKISNSEKKDNIVVKNMLLKKDQKYLKNWRALNKKLQDGLMILRPTNKTIADILGICERQVVYYLQCARKKTEEMKKEIEDNIV